MAGSKEDSQMADLLNEVTADDLSRDQIQRRVEDWAQRIEKLYREIEEWLPAGYSAEQSRTKRMHEELMREVRIPPRDLPIRKIVRDSQPVATIEPRGLWIIGANGRLDLISGQKHFVIVDAAESFHPPIWQIAPLNDRRKLDRFDRTKLLSAL
jgi:hypothetical protein